MAKRNEKNKNFVLKLFCAKGDAGLDIKCRSILFFSLLSLLLIYACSSGKQSRYSKSKALMDTFVTITVVTDSPEKAEHAIDKAFEEIESFGNLIDFFSDKSDIKL